MMFGNVKTENAGGAILAHTIRKDGFILKKGTVLTNENLAALDKAGISTVMVLRLDSGDVVENDAALQLATAVAHNEVNIDAPVAGRVNLRANQDGLCHIDVDKIHAINRIDQAVTIATVEPFGRVSRGSLIATVKIIPLAVSQAALHEAVAAAHNAISVEPFMALSTVLIATSPVSDKTIATTASRVEGLGGRILQVLETSHNVCDLETALGQAEALNPDLILLAGHTATVDIGDTIPSAILSVGGEIEHFGMPVDPGNLLVLGRLRNARIVVMPGCARSPARNGFDSVLERLAAGVGVSSETIMAMGVGGLLKEIPSRPFPRETRASQPVREPTIRALLLAAGGSRRMGQHNKLLEEIGGEAIVKTSATKLIDAGLPPLVVTGFENRPVERALSDLNLKTIHAADWHEGMSRSLRAGIRALSKDADAVLVALGDMPFIETGDIRRLVAAYKECGRGSICIPTAAGKRGNPVLFDRRFFGALMQVEGDLGGRAIIEANRDLVVEIDVAVDTQSDIDTPEALSHARDRYHNQR